MSYKWMIASYAFVISVCYLFIVSSSQAVFVAPALALFITLTFVKPDSIYVRLIRAATLPLLQWFIDDWWCLLLYFLVLGREYAAIASIRIGRFLSFAYLTVFLAVAAPNLLQHRSPPTIYYTLISAVLALVLGQLILEYMFVRSQRTERLHREQSLLISRDALTGLANFEEAHRTLEKLVAAGEPLLLILIDCADLKSMNVTKGYRTGNLILKQIAELLAISFTDARLIARYGGDEFAVALPLDNDERIVYHAGQLLDFELPNLTGIRMSYGMAHYPRDAATKDALLAEAENGLYMKKREKWLEREEHLLRSEKMRVVGELASGMAHEIRNPLTAVRGFLQISKSNGYNIEAWYGLIMEEIDRMSELTAEFLQFSKPQAADYRQHSLQGCLLRVIALTESEATRLGQQLVYEHPQEPIVMWMDADKMVQLLLNLVKNAYEAMPNGGTIFLRLRSQGSSAVIEVQDTGVGIPPERLSTIFNPFFTTKEYGTGLGLSISYQIVQDHEGTLEVESTVGEGTKFVLTFPLHVQIAAETTL